MTQTFTTASLKILVLERRFTSIANVLSRFAYNGNVKLNLGYISPVANYSRAIWGALSESWARGESSEGSGVE
jgi:hypothetical protein